MAIGTSHPLKIVFKNLKVRQLDVAAHCGVSISSITQFLNGYRLPDAALESRMQAYAAQKRREREAQGEVAGDE